MKEEDIPRGMTVEYSKSLKDAVKNYVTENDRTKTPILKYLKSVIESFEMQILGNMSTLEMYCIYHIEIEVNKFTIYFVKVNIDNQNLDNVRTSGGAVGSVGGEMVQFNKNYIKFLHKLNEDRKLTEDTGKIELALFANMIDEQFKELKKLRGL